MSLTNWSVHASIKARMEILTRFQEQLLRGQAKDLAIAEELLFLAPEDIRDFLAHNNVFHRLLMSGFSEVPVTLENEGFGETNEEAEIIVEKLRRAWICNVRVEKEPHHFLPQKGFRLRLFAEPNP